MNSDSLLTHSQYVEKTIATLDDARSFVFGASVCQRVVPLLRDELSRKRTVERATELEHRWELIWEAMADLRDRPIELSAFFKSLVPSPGEAEVHQEYFHSANLLYGFAASVESGDASGMLYISDASFALLDNFLHRSLPLQPSSEADATIFSHHLVKMEVQRQTRDLDDVQYGSVREAAIRLWQRSRQECVFDKSDNP